MYISFQVNEVDVSDMSHNEAVMTLKNAGKHVTIVVLREITDEDAIENALQVIELPFLKIIGCWQFFCFLLLRKLFKSSSNFLHFERFKIQNLFGRLIYRSSKLSSLFWFTFLWMLNCSMFLRSGTARGEKRAFCTRTRDGRN